MFARIPGENAGDDGITVVIPAFLGGDLFKPLLVSPTDGWADPRPKVHFAYATSENAEFRFGDRRVKAAARASATTRRVSEGR